MELGSKEHQAHLVYEMLKTYQENIWKDGMTIIRLEEQVGEKRKEIAAIQFKLDNKEFKTKNEGKKALFVAERELEGIEKSIATYKDAIASTWPYKMETVRLWAEKQGIPV